MFSNSFKQFSSRILQPAGSARPKVDSEILLIYLLSLISCSFLMRYLRIGYFSKISPSFGFFAFFDSSQHHRTLRFFRFLVLKGLCFLERALFSGKEACFRERALSV